MDAMEALRGRCLRVRAERAWVEQRVLGCQGLRDMTDSQSPGEASHAHR